MPVHIQLHCADECCRAVSAGESGRVLAETPLDRLPAIEELVGDPPGTPNRRRGDPFGAGVHLYQALGGDALRALLDSSVDGVLLVECDAAVEQVAWEYAAAADRRFLACDYGMVRLIPRPPLSVDWSRRPRLLVLCADPLFYPDGGVPAYPLNFPEELAALDRALAESESPLDARRLPPTEARLRAALAGGPAILHFSCHGSQVTIPQAEGGQETDVVLMLEDDDGGARPLLGRDLLSKAPRGSVRMALLSACQSAPLARSLVARGVPAALGMQHNFPDPLSGELAAAFYRFLAAGHDVAEAARQARIALVEKYPLSMGLLVAYTCQDAWGGLPTADHPAVVALGLPQTIRMPGIIAPPAGGLLGRDAELALVAGTFSATETRAVTIVGAGGMGKTALAASFVQRFGWRFRRVLGVTFASNMVSLTRVCRELLERLGLAQAVGAIQSSTELATLAADQQEAVIATRLHDQLLEAVQPGDLLVFDNCESIITPDPDQETPARRVMSLLPLLIGKGARLLLTSRAHPAGLSGEVLVPEQGNLGGLPLDNATELFCISSATISSAQRDLVAFERYQAVARQVASVTEGYPLAIQLLASAYDSSPDRGEAFLTAWPERMAEARRAGLGERHASFVAALEYSLVPLNETRRERLQSLAIFEVPFFAEGAALLWGLPTNEDRTPTDEALSEAQQELHGLVACSLIQIEGRFEGTDEAATFRFQPAIRQELQRRAMLPALSPGYVAYGAWLARRVYGQIGQSSALANLAHRSLPILDAATATLIGDNQLWHIRRVAWLRQQFGELSLARTQLEHSLGQAPVGTAVRSAILHELAHIYCVQGELDRAMQLYQESLTIKEALKDVQGKSTTLHAIAYVYTLQGELDRAMQLCLESLTIHESLKDMQGKGAILRAIANIYTIQGELDRAMQLYQESLTIHEALKDIKGKSATLHEMAFIYTVQGQLDQAMQLCKESQTIHEALKDIKGKSATLHAMANIYRAQGNLDRAMQLYQESLTIRETLKDMQGKSITLHEIATIYRVQGDLDRAMQLYQESLTIKETLKDMKGKSATLGEMAIVEMQRGQWSEAETHLQDALRLVQQLRDQISIGFTTVQLGQVAEGQGDLTTAITRFREGLVIFERLRMPREAQQVGELLASIEAQLAVRTPLAQAIQAWSAHQGDDGSRQEDLVALLDRIAGLTIQVLRQGYQSAAEELAEQLIPLRTALLCWPAAVTLPPFNLFLGCLQALLRGDIAQLAQLRGQIDQGLAQALAEVERQSRLSPEQWAEVQAHMQQIAQTAHQAAEATRTALSNDPAARSGLIAELDETIAYYAEGEEPGSIYDRLAGFLRACGALLRGEPPPQVTEEYHELLRQLICTSLDSEVL